jgi:hypothetical protein
MKRFIELKCDLEVETRGKKLNVNFFVMLTSEFPKKPPYIRIYNNDRQLKATPFYEPLKSPTDPNSYILNSKLSQIQNWSEKKSIVNVIIEAHNLMRKEFPFTRNAQNQNLYRV